MNLSLVVQKTVAGVGVAFESAGAVKLLEENRRQKMVYRKGISWVGLDCRLKIVDRCIVIEVIVVIEPALGFGIVFRGYIRRRGSFLSSFWVLVAWVPLRSYQADCKH